MISCERLRRQPATSDLHDAVHLPDDQSRRPAVLDSRLLPVHRETILWSKFFFAGRVARPCSLLVLLSDAMLRVDAPAPHPGHVPRALHGLASRLAWGPDASLRETSPSRIAASLGHAEPRDQPLYIVAVS